MLRASSDPEGKKQMNTKPLVSVVIIFLNAEKFIEEAIESVFAQTYSHWELVLVDDGSTDRSTHIARRYAKQYPGQVRYLEHEDHQNRGKSVSRNLGIDEAGGEYIAFLDADDVWLPHKLERQVVVLDSHSEAAMVYGRSQYWYSWTREPKNTKRDRIPKLGIQPDSLVKPPKLLTLLLRDEHMRKDTICPYPSSVLVRRSVFTDIGAFEENFRDLYDDVVFFAKVFLEAPVFVAGGCWTRYRLHPNDGFSNSYVAAMKTEQWHPYQANPSELNFLNWLKEYVSKQNPEDIEVRTALSNSLLPYRYKKSYRLLRYAQHLIRQIKQQLKLISQRTLPAQAQKWLSAQWQSREFCPPVGCVRFGSLRRVTPISRSFGFDRGLPIDRYYVERFLGNQSGDIRKHVLEIGDDAYTRKFGDGRVITSDVLHVTAGNSRATIVADLTCANHIPSSLFDCIVLTQTLQFIYDVPAALKTLHRILKPGGGLVGDRSWYQPNQSRRMG